MNEKYNKFYEGAVLNRKLSKSEIYTLDITDIYEIVKQGRVYKVFPSGIWQRPDADDNATKLVRYIIEKNKYSTKDIYNLGTKVILKKANINIPSYVRNNFEYGIYTIFKLADPKINLFLFKPVPQGYWNKDSHIKEALEYHMREDNIKSIYDISTEFLVHKWGMKEPKLKYKSVAKLVCQLYPDAIPYEFESKYFKLDDWTPKFSRGALEYHMNKTNIKIENLNSEWFRKNKLRTLTDNFEGIGDVLNYCYETDIYSNKKYFWTRKYTINILKQHIANELTPENIRNTPNQKLIEIINSPFRKLKNNRENLIKWIFECNEELFYK